MKNEQKSGHWLRSHKIWKGRGQGPEVKTCKDFPNQKWVIRRDEVVSFEETRMEENDEVTDTFVNVNVLSSSWDNLLISFQVQLTYSFLFRVKTALTVLFLVLLISNDSASEKRELLIHQVLILL